MTARSQLRQLTRALQSAPDPVPPPAPEPEPSELARELFRAFTDELAAYKNARDQAADRPDPS